jgi:hypothetical protein
MYRLREKIGFDTTRDAVVEGCNAAINLNKHVAQGYWETENGRGEGVSLWAGPSNPQ